LVLIQALNLKSERGGITMKCFYCGQEEGMLVLLSSEAGGEIYGHPDCVKKAYRFVTGAYCFRHKKPTPCFECHFKSQIGKHSETKIGWPC